MDAVASECNVSRRTLYNWRQLEEFKRAFAEAKGSDVDQILLDEVLDKKNPQHIRLWYERHGLLKGAKDLGETLEMSDEDRERILKLAHEEYVERHGTGSLRNEGDAGRLQDLSEVG